MRTINIYTFDELSDDAKQAAIKSAREKGQHDDMEYWIPEAAEVITEAAKAFNFRLVDYSIGTEVSRSWVKLAGNSIMQNEELTGMRLRTWLMNNLYWIFYEKKAQRDIKFECKRRSNIIYVETDCPFTGICYDYSFLKVFREFIAKPTDQTLEELFEEGVHNLAVALEEEEQYHLQDSSISEYLISNQYEFTEEGEFV